MDQKEIFNIILFDMIKYKINNIDQETIDTSNTFIYMILKNWIKNKEISIQKTKPAKYHKHLPFRVLKIKLYSYYRTNNYTYFLCPFLNNFFVHNYLLLKMYFP